MTTTSRKSLSFFFELDTQTVYVGVPTLLTTKNDLDAHGVFLDLKRLPGENGVNYYKRLRSVIPLRASSSQLGLVHGITRELGLSEDEALVITPKTSAGTRLAEAPYVKVSSTKIALYGTYFDEDDEDNILDIEVDLFDRDDNGYLIKDLVSTLSLGSEYFDITQGSDVSGEEISLGLIPSESNTLVEREYVPPSTFFYLNKADLVPGSLAFEDSDIFDLELSPDLNRNPDEVVAGGVGISGISFCFILNDPTTEEGEYYVNYEEGWVQTNTASQQLSTCRYQYRDFPFKIKYSPVCVYSVRDSEYQEKLFETETMPDTSTRLGLVTKEGADVYSQAFEKSPSMWGE